MLDANVLNSRNMQDCFRAHPDVYGAELEPSDDDDIPEQEMAGPEPTSATLTASSAPSNEPSQSPSTQEVREKRERAKSASQQVAREHGQGRSESEDIVPKAWHDAREDNQKAE